jgi:hypothetical protein
MAIMLYETDTNLSYMDAISYLDQTSKWGTIHNPEPNGLTDIKCLVLDFACKALPYKPPKLDHSGGRVQWVGGSEEELTAYMRTAFRENKRLRRQERHRADKLQELIRLRRGKLPPAKDFPMLSSDEDEIRATFQEQAKVLRPPPSAQPFAKYDAFKDDLEDALEEEEEEEEEDRAEHPRRPRPRPKMKVKPNLGPK